MEPGFWHERWARNEIGFHQDVVTPLLAQFWGSLSNSSSGTVFVPLCGKSKDLLWLVEQGFEVVGVELDLTAVESFFEENDLEASMELQGDLREFCCTTRALTIYQGDFFALPDEVFTRCDLVFDRGSLIALPDLMRRAYVEKLKTKLVRDTEIMLVTLEHSSETSPPFSLNESEVRDLYEDEFSVQRLGDEQEEFRGETALNVVYRVTSRSNRKQC